MGAMHMSLLGPEGLEELAIRNMAACTLAKQKLGSISGLSIVHQHQSHFNEFAIEVPDTGKNCLTYLEEKGIIGGFDLSWWYPDQPNRLLLTFTDQTSGDDIEYLATQLQSWVKEVVA